VTQTLVTLWNAFWGFGLNGCDAAQATLVSQTRQTILHGLRSINTDEGRLNV